MPNIYSVLADGLVMWFYKSVRQVILNTGDEVHSHTVATLTGSIDVCTQVT